MKKKLLFVSMLFVAFTHVNIFAQTYTFSQTTETYSSLTGATKISTDFWDDFSVFSVTLPFSFTFFDGTFTKLYINDGTAMFHDPNVEPGYEMYVCDAELMDRGTASSISTINYLVSGSAPNRIFKLEWNDAGFSNDDSGSDNAFFQIWLYETSNKIEYHFGAINAQSGDWDTGVGATSAILNSNGSELIMLTGNPASPTVNTTTSNGIYLTGAPASGQVYIFTRNVLSVKNSITDLGGNVYPNPFNDVVNIDTKDFSDNSTVIVSDVNGVTVYVGALQNGSIDLSHLSKGIYFVAITSESKTGKVKLVKL